MYIPSSSILEKLKELKILVFWNTLCVYHHQGFMSQVYEVDSSVGKLMIHITQLSDPDEKENRGKKFLQLQQVFRIWNNPKIPKYYCIEYGDLFLITIQQKIPGNPAGTRSIVDGVIMDDFQLNNTDIYFQQLLSELASVHTQGLKRISGDELKGIPGGNTNWKRYLETHFREWIRLSSLTEHEYEKIIHIVNGLSETSSCLIHGDSINPSNILIGKDSEICGIIDWEWATIGDPAWEFADIGWKGVVSQYGLEQYFLLRNISSSVEKKDFLERIEKYHILWLLWGTSIHRKDEDQMIFISLRNLLLSELSVLK